MWPILGLQNYACQYLEVKMYFTVGLQQISNWKNEFLRRSTEIFNKREPDKELEKENEKLFTKIGRLEIENDWLKKKL